MALLLMGALLALWMAWWVLLSLHPPFAPHLPTGQAEALRLQQQDGATLSVRSWEAAVSIGLAIAAFVVPAAYLAWEAIRRRIGR